MEERQATDLQLVTNFKNGVQEAFDELDRRYRARLIHVIMGMVHNYQDAEDIYQEAILKAATRIDSFQSGGDFYNWLYTIAINQARDVLRRKKRNPTINAEMSESITIPISHADPLYQLEQCEIDSEIAKAIDKLPPRQQQVVQLRLFDSLKYAQIAEQIGGHAATIKSLFCKARQNLKLRLKTLLVAVVIPERKLFWGTSANGANLSTSFFIAIAIHIVGLGIGLWDYGHSIGSEQPHDALVVSHVSGASDGKLKYIRQNEPHLQPPSQNTAKKSVPAMTRVPIPSWLKSPPSFLSNFLNLRPQIEPTQVHDITHRRMPSLSRLYSSTPSQGNRMALQRTVTMISPSSSIISRDAYAPTMNNTRLRSDKPFDGSPNAASVLLSGSERWQRSKSRNTTHLIQSRGHFGLTSLVGAEGAAGMEDSLADVTNLIELGNGPPSLPKDNPGAIIAGRGRDMVGSLNLVRLEDSTHPSADIKGSGIGSFRFGVGLSYLVKMLNRETKIKTQLVDAVKISDAAFLQTPIHFMEPIPGGAKAILENQRPDYKSYSRPVWNIRRPGGSSLYVGSEAHRLREYLIKRGGFIYMLTHGNATQAMKGVRKILREVLPEYQLEWVANDHLIFNIFYPLNGPLRFPIRKIGHVPLHFGRYSRLQGVTIDGRIAVLVDTEQMMHVLDGAIEKPFYGYYANRNQIVQDFAPAAARQLINIIIYATTHGNISDYSNYVPERDFNNPKASNICIKAPQLPKKW